MDEHQAEQEEQNKWTGYAISQHKSPPGVSLVIF
jgi:hypothetical protein